MTTKSIRYTLEQIEDIIFKGFDYEISNEVIEKISNLAIQVGSPDYVKTPIFKKNDNPTKIDSTYMTTSKDNSDNKKKKRNRGNEILNDEDWVNLRTTFQPTKIETKIGIDADFDLIRSLINKITDKNYIEIRNKIVDIIEKVVNEQAESNLINIGTNIFDPGWEREYKNTSVNDLLIASGIYMGEYCTKELFEFLRNEFPGTLVTAFVCDEDAISMALKKDYVYVSTNAADGPHYPGIGAPEVSGTFPRLIGRYVREKKELSLIEAIKKITILPATRFGLKDIGSIEVGKNADIVIFDLNKIIDEADFIGRGKPDAPPLGIEYVVINGKRIVENGELTNDYHSGRLIRR